MLLTITIIIWWLMLALRTLIGRVMTISSLVLDSDTGLGLQYDVEVLSTGCANTGGTSWVLYGDSSHSSSQLS